MVSYGKTSALVFSNKHIEDLRKDHLECSGVKFVFFYLARNVHQLMIDLAKPPRKLFNVK